MKCWLQLLLVGATILCHVSAFSSGPPSSVCSDMNPSHGSTAQVTPCPYILSLSGKSLDSDKPVNVTLSKFSPQTPDFKGFLIKAVLADNESQIVGSFSSFPDFFKGISCDGRSNSALSHGESSAKSAFTVTWIPDKGFNAVAGQSIRVLFLFTIVQTKAVFWTRQEATSVLEIKAKESSKSSMPEDLKATNPHFSSCFKDKGCFGLPQGCEIKGTCSVMAAYSHSGDQFVISLVGRGLSDNHYLAMALSSDDSMGSDLVFSCSKRVSDGISVSWNLGKSNSKDAITGVLLTDQKITVEDDITACQFKLSSVLKATLLQSSGPAGSEVAEFDLSQQKYHLLLATGPEAGSGRLSQHSDRIPSVEPISLKLVNLVGSSVPVLMWVHGSMMVLSWLACATTGIMTARYFKRSFKAWSNKGHKDVWFRVHQLMMGLAASMTVVAFIVILSDKGGQPLEWASVKRNPHSAIGLSCVLGAILQPIMAFFRPHPDQKQRWIFNWAHWFLGNATYLLAIASIFLAVELPSAKLPKNLSDAMIAFVVINSIVHLVYMGLSMFFSQSRQLTDQSSSGEEAGSPWRMGLAGLYFAYIWIFAAAFVAVIVLATTPA